eukprot:CAMPEP_0172457354 /NCGR_PEP_ID=MMETSP1065-20121228/21691_1 /TAXON_ID=265537 /ORGANISM="Amphiprora paludosa, Strain CCMP125" /LENGTH=224 /DNA_ID=CAMNT_0013211041 /DNA_START=110 /DNA_END=784 /DNA_ORIENTATION=+
MAMPSIVLDGGETKCVLFEAAMDTKIKIDYKAPDINVDKDDPGFSPAYISVHVKPSNRVLDTRHHDAPVRSHFHPTNQMLEKTEGRIRHTFEVAGEASICFKAPKSRKGAHSDEKYRFHYHIHIADGLDGDEEDEGDGKSEIKADIDGHLTFMEKELQRIQRGMQSILREADFAKEREALFHKQTENMNNATMFWPIVQVCVLLMTGFTQASHIVQFFKKRRII